MNVVYSQEAIEEVNKLLNSRNFYVDTSGKIAFSSSTDTVDYLMKTLTGNPVDENIVSKETYQEHGTSTFTHNGHEYDLNKIFVEVEDEKIIEIKINELDWVLAYDKPDTQRLAKANYEYPILVYKDKEHGLTAVDGLHRLAKAKKNGQTSIKAKMVSDVVMENARIK